MWAFKSVRPSLRLKRGLATISQNDFHIPVINFSKFRSATSDVDKKDTANEIVDALKSSGFMYLSQHGISDKTINTVFKTSAEFFELSPETKDKLAWADPRSNRGFVRVGRERVTTSANAEEIKQLREKAPDFKETMEIGRDWGTEWPNQWPSETDAPKFKEIMLNFFQTCHLLQMDIMRSIALGLDLEEGFFDNKINDQSHNLRLLSYPSIKTSLLDGEGQARAGAHTDYGTLTLLMQDQVGGLQVQNPYTKVYHAAPPVPGTIVINVGDLLSRWSNNVLRSTLHRVVAPTAVKINDTEALIPHRQSIAFFSNPNFSADIECLPTCLGSDGALYPKIKTSDYIVGRLSATYS